MLEDAHFVLSSSNSTVYSWGEGSYGELGLGCCKTKVEQPTAIKHKASFSSISCGECHGAAVDQMGNAYSWGQNFDRQLGLYRKDSSNFRGTNCVVEEIMFVPSLLPFSLNSPILKISCGARFTVAVGINGDLWSWGAGECGQLGTGRCTRRESPKIITFPFNKNENDDDNDPFRIPTADANENINCSIKIVDVACGASHVIAIADDSSVYGWGMNKRGHPTHPNPPPRYFLAENIFRRQFQCWNQCIWGIIHMGIRIKLSSNAHKRSRRRRRRRGRNSRI